MVSAAQQREVHRAGLNRGMKISLCEEGGGVRGKEEGTDRQPS